MSHAIYTWMLLDFQKRWDFLAKFESTLTKTLTAVLPILNKKFEEIYSKHTCKKPGCSHPNRTLIGDGNLKSTRRLCGAESAGMDKFETTGVTVLTGCKNIPITGRKFCRQCENKTPHISHKSISKENLLLLRDPKFPETSRKSGQPKEGKEEKESEQSRKRTHVLA